MGKIKSKSILEMSAEEARKFLLKKESYSNIDLPKYIDFQPLLDRLSEEIKNKKLPDICFDFKNDKPSDYEDVNHTLLANKDGRFSWRPLKLINPALYVLLVHQITDTNQWLKITKRFSKIAKKISPFIKCKSWSRSSEIKESDKAVQVSNWWYEIEQISLKKSIDFSHIIHADVADCYGSIYTHSIPWAIHGRKKAKIKKNRGDINLIGNNIDTILQSMSYGQTNGIPQGSILMDFLAEIVLGYADLIIYTELKTIKDYRIIRYRDDYRIFTQNESDGLKILKVLTETLAELGWKLNAGKTVSSDNLIKNSIKPDKWFLLDNTIEHKSVQKQLMFIHKLSGLYPNSGSVKKELYRLYDKRLYKRKSFVEDIYILISISSDIAYRNPLTYPVISAILSKFFANLDDKEKDKSLNKILNRFSSIPHTGFLDIWLQRIVITNEMVTEIKFKEPLCQIISNEVDNSLLWELNWLKEDLKHICQNTKIINNETIKKMKPIVEPKEIALFLKRYS